ncbi:hypothetical protein LTR56_024164 [Elasticomyces elasticus]|nr:hypothetical protein LTR56_024164 [Elasticomyces elasticus]KAK3622282.1 hypothetical protein LTR22_024868 [Elasticomyces elasticus]KAK4906438.1 hypothetical protein LTR49_024407 [Elasticomyces elasticus]KAK5754859.1 hypothetical protein LTS12_015075 [Elasticomyces elasticus]
MSDSSGSPEATVTLQSQASKRTADAAGLKPGSMRPAKSVKRRASKACQCCRSRKVRCNVVEHGAPCTNCRLDEVECIVSESKRKKKWTTNEMGGSPRNDVDDEIMPYPMSAHPPYEPLKRNIEHTPHTLYQDLSRDATLASATANSSLYTPNMLLNLQRLGRKPSSADVAPMLPNMHSQIAPSYSLPLYIKPLPSRFGPDDVLYLEKKGALAIPTTPLRNELLRCYAEFVHPYMPLLNMNELVRTIDRNDGSDPISLLLFQAIMFAGIATVDMRYLKAAGYDTRRDARREFFQKTRLLYDFDIEVDRISLIQSLLLMTYWYETPDDQKDSHHWMGIAVSLSHTIGLHRNPAKSQTMDLPKQRLWRRMWWSTYMRDRLVALGMRRPTRIKDADYDVPMLSLEDFEDDVLSDEPSCMPADCTILRDAEKQRQLAVMCIAKVKLCMCISNVLSVQYSVLHNNHGLAGEEGTTRTTNMLVKKLDPELNEVQACDKQLQEWKDALEEEAKYVEPTWQDVDAGNEDVVLNRSLLHMIYYAALSALHRPQVLPSTAMPPRETQATQLEASRKAVRLAASGITGIANSLYNLDLVRYLPTTGITTLLPAIIIHLLDIKAPEEATRKASLQGFCQCMQIMSRLRDIYAAADYSTAFLEAAIRKAEITLPQRASELKEPRSVITSTQALMDAGRRMTSGRRSGALTPPPEAKSIDNSEEQQLTDDDIARQLNSYLATTPPDSDHQPSYDEFNGAIAIPADFEPDFDSMLNLDATGETWVLEDGAYAAMQGGESSGYLMDTDSFMKSMHGGLEV